MSDTDKVFVLVHRNRQTKNIKRKYMLKSEALTISGSVFWISRLSDWYLSPVLHSPFHFHSAGELD